MNLDLNPFPVYVQGVSLSLLNWEEENAI